MAAGSPVAYGWYWLAPFVIMFAWGVFCIATRRFRAVSIRRHGYPRLTFAVANGIVALLGTAYIIAMPLAVRLSWWQVPLLFAACYAPALTAFFLIPRDSIRSRQQLGITSWIGVTAIFMLAGYLTRVPIWYVGGAVLLAASAWNTYSELVVKPAVHELYSDVDDESLWSGPPLPEEATTFLMLLVVLVYHPLPLGSLSAELARSGFRASLFFLLPLGAMLLSLGLYGAMKAHENANWLCASRLARGAAFMLGGAILAGCVASAVSRGSVSFAVADLIKPIGHGASGLSFDGVVASLWSMMGALVVGSLGAVVVATGVLTRGPEHDFFLSYATEDAGHASEIVNSAESRGLREFFADKSLRAGDDFRLQIQKAIRNSGEVVVLMSPRSIESQWVQFEWTAALALEKRVTVVLLDMEPEQVPDPLRHRQCIRFHEVDELLGDIERRVRLRRPRPLAAAPPSKHATSGKELGHG